MSDYGTRGAADQPTRHTLADALQVICDIDLAELQAIDPPRGFGRD